MSEPSRPVLIYDGECHFCGRWVVRWQEMTGDRVIYRPSQEAAADYPEIPAEDFDRAVQWVGTDGKRASAAGAVFCALALAGWWGRLLLTLYRRVAPWRVFVEFGYRIVATNRMVFSRLTRLLWGNDVRAPRYALASGIFLRVLAVIYLIALISYWRQSEGLTGAQGILPMRPWFDHLWATYGWEAVWQLPSVLWFDWLPVGVWCAAGCVVAGLVAFGIAPLPGLIFLWAVMLSLVVGGQVFYQFQWDNLLLEAGFLAIFLSPLAWRVPLRASTLPPWLARGLLIWLLMRLMIASAVVKLSSGDPTWANGSALEFHYYTQPLPTPLAWWAHQLPAGLHRVSVWVMFAIELGLPVLLLFPRRVRHAAAGGLIGLQLLIALTGNYGFFNLLTVALCLLAIDDSVWSRLLPPQSARAPARHLPTAVLGPVAAAVFFLSLVPFSRAFRHPVPTLAPLEIAYRWVAPFRSLSSYGLFAVMTTTRTEILVQGSLDGVTWKTYSFRDKPGDTHRAPPWVAPYMPRLDWQMWFAALGRVENNPWFVAFLQRLLEGSPAVLDLLDGDPFDGARPKFVRALVDDYTFTTLGTTDGAWWRAEPGRIYCPELSLR
jgi:lipase maturation factor 1